MKSTTEIIKESEELEDQVIELLKKYKCSNEDLGKAMKALHTIYFCGFYVGYGSKKLMK